MFNHKLWQAILFFILALMFLSEELVDRQVARVLHVGGSSVGEEGWIYKDTLWSRFTSWVSPMPTILFIVGGAALFFYSLKTGNAIMRRRAFFVLALTAIVPGLLVNGILKEIFGRPRPRMTQEFGGEYVYQPWYHITRKYSGKAKSFPSGHAATAAMLIAPFWLFRNRRTANLALVAGLLWWLFVSLGRMLPGGHYPSDCLGGLFFVILVGQLLAYALKPLEPPVKRKPAV